ncbi:uncharacterized protein EHS24_008792 [Apiotrichum porosum]|uniref:Retrovirus-related Pol polyprotein from transposon TNT 1-94-like beta-barrel domain-containing protein n=1 Tax=Apiotrichum porosum TaxID=105984 RepID=A0A427XMS1_9TREE|nr:uncharacterized protein EHS24_008792 [Apiotrichum porosum]RSH80219.1 hypothetical protein EHS24_008792 [Apiotrichum porosum]
MTRFRKENVSRISQIKAKVHSTRLQAGASSAVCNTFFKSFVTNYAAMARLQKPYADEEKVSTIIGALPVTYKILIETTWRAQSDKTWDNFTSVFYDFINDLKNTERIPAVESNASLTITKGGKTGQPNAARTKKGKDSKVAKHCDNHPNSTSHDTSECVRGPPKKNDKKKVQKQVDKAPTPAPTSSASIVEIEDAYYDGSSSSMAVKHVLFSPSARVCAYHPHSAPHAVSECVRGLQTSLCDAVTTKRQPVNRVASNSNMTVECFSSSSSSSFKFLVDTGCTEHIVSDQSILFGVKPVPVPLRVRLGGSRFHLILSTVGSMRIAQDDNTTVIHDVYYSADTTDLTISTKALRRHGWTVDLHNFRIYKGKVVFKTDDSYEGGRPAVDFQVTSSSYAAMTTRRPPSTSARVKPSNAPTTQSIPTLDATQTSAQTPQTPVTEEIREHHFTSTPRDKLSFTWDYRTFNFRENIGRAAADLLHSTPVMNVRLFTPTPKIERPYPDLSFLQFSVAFDTKLVHGSAMINAVLTKEGWKLWTVHTAAEDLINFPELPPADGHMTGDISWESQRAKDVDEIQPDVLIVGGGQNGIALAPRLKALGVSHLIIERGDTIGEVCRKVAPRPAREQQRLVP